MSVREKFFRAIRRMDDSYVPFEFILCPSLAREFKYRTGREDYEDYYGFPTRNVYLDFINSKDRYSVFHEPEEGLIINDWGIGFIPGKTGDFHSMRHPMRSFENLEEFMAYPYPDPEKDYDWESLKAKVKAYKNRDLVAACYLEITIFETAWYLRGMDNLLVDMMTNPELADYLLDQITERRCVSARLFAEAGCDVLRLGDDVSTQLDMMISPEMWQRFLKPRLRRVISAAREANPEIMVFYHGCGNLQKIIPDLIETGVDILNPVQPECMDPVEIKAKFGDTLSFWGSIGTQTTMPFGTPEEVTGVCRNMIKELGRGGGLLLAPSHVLEPEVPWENIEAFVKTVKAYNDGADQR